MCTGIRLIAQNNRVIYARTLEFGENLRSNIVIIPRNYACIGRTPLENTPGLTWKSKYAVAGANALDLIEIVDGINEKGLAGGLFYFPGYADYQDVSHNELSHSIAPWQLMTWILTNFSSVSEVKAALQAIKISKTVFDEWGFVLPIHAIVHDPSGQSLVIEYTAGKHTTFDNPVGVFTNAPSFGWHMTNLNNYSALSAFNTPSITLGTTLLAPLGQGSGMFGLPGDFTSPSRFVRAVAFSKTVCASATEHEARQAAFHILNLFNIPLGIVRQKENNKIHYEYTQWTSASDLHNKRYYFHTYDNRQVRMIDLLQVNLNTQAPYVIAMESKEHEVDSTPT